MDHEGIVKPGFCFCPLNSPYLLLSVFISSEV